MNVPNENNESLNSMMTIGEAMMRLRVGRPCIQKLMDSGQLKSVQMSQRIIRISESALKEYIEQAENRHVAAPGVDTPEPGVQPEALADDTEEKPSI
jgi:excisionase family DNA binding protein